MGQKNKTEVRRRGDMTEGPILKQLISFALPLLFGSIFQLMYSMTDSIIVGKFVSADALAAIGATGTTLIGLMSVAMGITNAYTIVISQQYGAKNDSRVKKAVSNALWITAALGIFIGIASLVGAEPMMRLLGTPDNIIQQSVTYIKISGGLTIGMLFYNAASSILKSVGDSKTPLYFLIFCSVLNLIMDLIFVLALDMGVAGVAWATVVSQMASAVLSMTYMLRKYPMLRFNKSEAAIDWPIMKEILRIGIPMGLTQVLLSVGMLVVTGVVNSFGSDVVAVYTIGGKVNQIAMVSFGQFAFSFTVFAGQNYGAKQYKRIMEGAKKAVLMVVALSLISSVVIFTFARQVVLLFVNEGEAGILADSIQMIHIVSCFYLFLGVIWVYNCALRGVGAVRATLGSSVVELMAKVGLSIILSRQFGSVGIWFAEPIGWILGLMVSSTVFYRKKWIPQEEKM